MSSTDVGRDFLEHHGVKGMKWGVRRKRNESDRAKTFGSKGRKSGAKNEKSVKDLTDTELRQVLNRMQMEKQYNELTGTRSKNAGAEFAKSIAMNIARTQITNAINAEIAKTLAGRRS